MNIRQNRENRVIIELSAEDLASYDLSYKDIDYADSRTRKLLGDLLSQAENQLGKKLSGFEKFMIDVLPESDGGCILLLYLRSSDAKAAALLCELKQPEAVFPLAEILSLRRKKVLQSRLFLADGKNYVAYVRPSRPCEREIRLLLSEYGDVRPATSLSTAYLAEHAVLLSEDLIGSLTF